LSEEDDPLPKSTKKIQEVIKSLGTQEPGWQASDLDAISPGRKRNPKMNSTEWEASDLQPLSPENPKSKKRQAAETPEKPQPKKRQAKEKTMPLVPRKQPRVQDPKLSRETKNGKEPKPDKKDILNLNYALPLVDESICLSEAELQKRYGSRTEAFYSKAQTDLTTATKAIATSVGLPNTKIDLGNWVDATRLGRIHRNKSMQERKKLIEQTKKDWNRFEKQKHVEAEIMQWDSIEAMNYEVEEGGDVHKGTFHARLKETGKVIIVCRDWVVRNFQPEVWKSIVNQSKTSDSKFVPVDTDKGLKVQIDSRQVQKLRYVFHDESTGKESLFQGIVSDGTYIDLSSDFVHKTLPRPFVKHVMKVGKTKQSKKFLHLPPGAPRTMEGDIMLDDKYPTVRYLQQGRSTCLFSSLASALFFLGLTDKAEIVASKATKYSADAEGGIFNWNGLLQTMSMACKWLQPVKIIGNVFDILEDISKFPTVLSLEAVDGGTQHAVTIVGRMIFDSNCERALALTKSNLDYCCSTDEIQGQYRKVHKGYRFREVPGKRRVLDSIIKKTELIYLWKKVMKATRTIDKAN